jgi:hypothetical protein
LEGQITIEVSRAPSLRRPWLRDLCLGLSAAFVGFVATAGGCSTGAVGVEACRDIELARCEAAQYCGRIDDVAACRRFYNNHCLHGLADGVEQPAPEEVDACVKTIENAGKCAKNDPLATLEECPDVTSDARGATRACEIVLLPEWSIECSFLGPKGDLPRRPDGGAGGTTGAGGHGGAP